MAQPVSYIIFDIELLSLFSGKSMNAAGGKFYVLQNTKAIQQTIYDPDNNFAAVTQPKALIEGKMRFAIQNAGGGQASPPTVDITGISGSGYSFMRLGMTPGDVPTLYIDTNRRNQTAFVPYDFAVAGANVEYDTGIQLPANTFVYPTPAVNIVAIDTAGGHTIQFGVLATPAGFATGISTATVAMVAATLTGATNTMGSSLQVVSNATTVEVPQGVILAAAIDISYKLSASNVSGSGFLIFDYRLPQNL